MDILKYEEWIMIKIRILDILNEQGKTKYWLCKRLGMHYVSFNKLVNNETNSIRFDTLDRISTLLNVSTGELFEYRPDESENNPGISS